jgi:uncharacterized protein (UPF0303 family)
MSDDDLDELIRQEEELQVRSFDNDDAWRLGCALVDAARARSAAVTIDITRNGQQLFHAALPGTSADNDEWAKRKGRVVQRFGHSSLYMGGRCRVQGTTLEAKYGVDPTQYAAHGGAFPVIVRGTGVVGAVVVSGLPQREDHDLVVAALRAFIEDDGRGEPA